MPAQIPHPHVSFHMRSLPAPGIAFSSSEGKRLLQEAMAQGTADCYFKLSEQFLTQAEPAYCGLASLAMVLNTLGVDPRRTWKGVWRWYSEELVNCCMPLEEVQAKGVTLQKVAALAQCNGASAEVLPYGSLSLDSFRERVASTCSQSDKYLVVSYSRKTLNQSGDGHVSPVGGFHAPSDHVLLMDVARFKYPPHWVPIAALYEAMSLLDPESGVPRGALVLSASTELKPALFSLEYANSASAAAAQTGGPWALQKLLSEALPALAASAFKEREEVQAEAASAARQKSVLQGLASAATALPKEAASMINVRPPGGCGTPGSSCSKGGASELLLAEIHCMPLYQVVSERLREECNTSSDNGSLFAERLVMLLLMVPESAWDLVPDQVRPDLLDLLRCSCSWRLELVAAEVDVLRAHLDQCLGITMNNGAGSGNCCPDQSQQQDKALLPAGSPVELCRCCSD